MHYLIVNTLDKECREFLEKEDVSAYQVIDWYKDDLSKVQSLGLSVSSFPCAFINFPDTGGLPEAYEVISEFSSVSELQEKTANRSEERNKEGESLPPLPPKPNVELFLGTLKLDPKFSLELLPYLALWSPADILNEQARKGFWARVKASKPYFMTDTIISDVEALALQCNIPLTD